MHGRKYVNMKAQTVFQTCQKSLIFLKILDNVFIMQPMHITGLNKFSRKLPVHTPILY